MALRQVGPWTAIERLGSGGNADVYRAADASGREVALKVIHRGKAGGEPYARFVREIEVVRALGATPGILPLVDAYVPSAVIGQELPWLAMPIAVPIRDALEGAQVTDVVGAVAQLADTLALLEGQHGIAHRDIKPGNLYGYDGSYVVGDFGLVAVPDLEGLTGEGRALGPMHFMPYEMLRDASTADPFKADVYSLAKTLWVLLTAQNYPPPGHQRLGLRGISISDYREHPANNALDVLIDRATSPDPSQRPTMDDFAHELHTWLDLPTSAVLVDVAHARQIVREKLERELAAQDEADAHRELAYEAVRRLTELVRPLNQALSDLHPRAIIDGPADEFTRNVLRTGGTSTDPEITFRVQRLSQVQSGPSYAPLVLRFGRTVELTASGALLVRFFIDIGDPRVMGTRFHWMPHQPWQAPVGTMEAERILRDAVRDAGVQLEAAAMRFADQAG